MYNCNEHNIICPAANPYGECMHSACTNSLVLTEYISLRDNYDVAKYQTARLCVICGRPTEDDRHFLCEECKSRAKKLLYPEGI